MKKINLKFNKDNILPITLIGVLVFIFIMVIFIFPIVGIVYNLIVRIKEINGGEEDEASKY